MNNNWLYEKYNIIEEEIGFNDINVDILSSLANNLRFYQENAIKRFIYYFEKSKNKNSNHILFEMATGSGKTLTMAALILYLYKKGYRNFIFFVNSTTILEKTKINFVDICSSKHLFKDIELNNKRVEIKAINNLEESSLNAINILFTTIQGLHNQLQIEKENSLNLEDIKNNKLVLLADEAHHLSTSTKKTIELKFENTWETTVNNLLNINKDNILLEFTATAETSKKEIQEKYLDKLIYKYSLKEFCQDGFSKRIGMIINRQSNKERILLALIINIFREDLLSSKGIALKPVILFKSDTINNSKINQEDFLNIIENLTEEDITKTLQNAQNNEHNTLLIKYMLKFFKEQNIKISHFIVKLKKNFKEEYILNVNEDKDKSQHQILLNSLEDYDNKIRAIFAVNKLNEGWDVLNLFDIVKLYATKFNKNTTQEAQLIGRGARYYPFYLTKDQEEDKYKRKYDKEDNPLSVLEMLHYHVMDENKFINELSKEIEKQGLLFEANLKQVEIDLKQDFRNTEFYKNGVIYVNKKLPYKDYKRFKTINNQLFSDNDRIILPDPIDINIEYRIIKKIKETDLEEGSKEISYYANIKKLKDIDFYLFYKAISKNKFFNFDNIKIIEIESIKDLYNYYKNSSITFLKDDKNLEISNEDIILGLLKILSKLQKGLNITEYIGTDLNEVKYIKEVFKAKTITVTKDAQVLNGKDYNYFAQNNFTGTSEEENLMRDIEGYFNNKDEYKEIYLLRNEKHFRLYNFKDGKGFEPDFVLFLKNKKDVFLNYQIFIEPKGEHLEIFDEWKQVFLNSLEKKYQQPFYINARRKQKIIGLPFYNNKNKEIFFDKLEKRITVNYKSTY